MGQTSSVYEINDNMELPCVKVQLDAHGRVDGIDRSFTLSKSNSSIIVGRATSNHSRPTSVRNDNCYISSPITSRHHARFILGDEKHPLKLVDEGSTHGTFVDMVKLRPRQEMSLKNRSVVTFGSEVLNGKSNYLPTSFTVIFMWHDAIPRAPNSSSVPRSVIRAPSPLSESEDEEIDRVAEKENAASSPSAIVVDSPMYIDLTGEPDAIEIQHQANQSGQPNIFDHENSVIQAVLRKSDEPEELLIVKETNIDGTSRPYRFDYEETDLEEEQDTTSQSSPPQEDFSSSVGDVSVAMGVPSPSRYQVESNEDEDVQIEREVGYIEEYQSDELIYQQDEDSGLEQDEESSQSEPGSLDYPGSDNASEEDLMLGDLDDEDDEDDDISSSAAALDYAPVTTYEQALNYLGASDTMRDIEISALFYRKVNEDPLGEEGSRDSIAIIARQRQSSKLRVLLEADELDNDDSEDEDDLARPGHSSAPLANILNFPGSTSTLSGYQCANPFGNGNNIEPYAMAGGLYDARLSYPPTYYGASWPSQTYLMAPEPAAATYQQSIHTSFNHSMLENGPSPKMQISNILYNTPIMAPLKNDKAMSPVESSELASELVAEAADDDIGNELPHTGGKRKFDQVDVDEVVVEDQATSTTSIPPVESDQPSPSAKDNLKPESSALQEVQETAEPHIIEVEALDMSINLPERGPPPSKKARLDQSSKSQHSHFRTLATHCIAGAVGAIGVLAAIVATTPLQVQEELFQSM